MSDNKEWNLTYLPNNYLQLNRIEQVFIYILPYAPYTEKESIEQRQNLNLYFKAQMSEEKRKRDELPSAQAGPRLRVILYGHLGNGRFDVVHAGHQVVGPCGYRPAYGTLPWLGIEILIQINTSVYWFPSV